MRRDRIKGKRISVLGMARSGLACARLLKANGAEVFVSEIRVRESLSSEINQLEKLGIEFEAGGHTPRVVADRDFIVVSPGVPLDTPILGQAQNQGIPIFSEIEVAFWLTDARVIGITGSNGKTTTVTLIGEILREDKREFAVGGNIGTPFSAIVNKVSPKGILVLELSSFQLERIEEFRPHVSSVLNITSDHLDRHPDLKSYMEAKLRLLENQGEEDFAVLNADDPNTRRLATYGRTQKALFSIREAVESGVFFREGKVISRWKEKEREIINVEEIGIRGPHNLSNASAACAICSILGVETDSINRALRSFKGVEHRLEEVGKVSGVNFVNDSKATNVDSVWYALQSVSPPIILIAGGKDKGGDFSKLRELVQKNVRALILLGQAKEKLKDALGDLVPTFDSATLEEAVRLGLEQAKGNETVLLSPGCASFDMFRDYQHRGEVFKSSVKSLDQKRNANINA